MKNRNKKISIEKVKQILLKRKVERMIQYKYKRIFYAIPLT